MKINDQFTEFCENFNILDNAISMRQLIRWNGRDLRNKENLAEHTHLVVACTITLMDYFKSTYKIKDFDGEKVLRAAMLHDSLELLRGDILSITKDAMDGLRDAVDKEEAMFILLKIGSMNYNERMILHLADLMAANKFLENELKYPNNDFAKKAYIQTKKKYDDAFNEFILANGYELPKSKETLYNFTKGYECDAGIDIVLTKDCVFLPMSTTSFSLDCTITPKEGEMAILCARTSAATKGLSVAMCPIDPNFTGKVTAIVHNVSNNIISYSKGESFCQYIKIPINNNDYNKDTVHIKKSGKRSDGKLGSTGI